MPHLLVVEKDTATAGTLRGLAAAEGFIVTSVRSLAEARKALAQRRVDVLVVDIHLPDGRGFDLLEDPSVGEDCDTIVITDKPCLDTAILALRRHVLDYIVKPVNVARVRGHLAQLAGKPPRRHELTGGDRLGPLVGRSPAMRRLYEAICRVAPTQAAVLIVGESGTGKELVSQTIHQLSSRVRGPLVAINCGAIPEHLIESELFGHEKGAFTGAAQRRRGVFERAEGGTLFLDEISEMPLELQVKLLRVLETNCFTRVGGESEITVSARVIAATNRDPADAVPQGKLREDLLYRLSVFPIWVPPLRERGEDVELLASHFLAELNGRHGGQRAFAPAMLERFGSYHWPGNVRELKNVVWRSFILSDGPVDVQLMPDPIVVHRPRVVDQKRVQFAVGMSLADAERQLIVATLRQFNDNKKRTAKALGISLKTLYNRLSLYDGGAQQHAHSASSAEEPAGEHGRGHAAHGRVGSAARGSGR